MDLGWSTVISAKSDFLFQLAVACQYAEERAAGEPDNKLAQRHAQVLQRLFRDAVGLPEDHELFFGKYDYRSDELAAAAAAARGPAPLGIRRPPSL